MSRVSTTWHWYRLLCTVTAVVLSLAPALAVHAGSYTYGTRQRTVNAGILVLGSANSTLPPVSPYVFYILNLRTDVKPVGWNIINPRAPSNITTEIKARWDPFSGGGTQYTVDETVTPNMAAYWEVPIDDTSATQLRQFDILYLPVPANGSFTPSQTEKLRQFVDSGGQLWLDYTGASTFAPTFLDISYTLGGAGQTIASLPVAGTVYARHPILSQPYLLTYQDFGSLGTVPVSSSLSSGGTGDFQNLFTTVLRHPASSSPVIVAGQLGAGQVIASALNIGGSINNYVSVPPNSLAYFGESVGGAVSAPNLYNAPAQDLKFLSDLIAWSETHPNENRTSRQNAAVNDVSSFASAWSVIPASSGATPPGAAVSGNFVYVTGADGILRAYDAYPSEDLTATGNQDDGVPDFSNGTAYDEVWQSSAAVASAPTVGSYNGQALVFAEDLKGSVYAYDAVSGQPYGNGTLPGSGSSSAFPGPTPAPTYYDGRVYAGEPDNTLYVYSLNGVGSAGTGIKVPLAAGGNPPVVTASPSVGIMPDGNVTSDIVAYVPTTQSLRTVFLGARADLLNKTLQGYNINRSRLQGLGTQVVDTAALPPPKVYATNGNPLSPAVTATGTMNPDFGPVNAAASVYGDYDMALSSNPITTLNQISAFSVNGAGGGNTATLSAPAVDRGGALYYTVDTVGSAGHSYLFGVTDGPQAQNLVLKFRFRLPQSGDGTIIDADGVNYTPLNGFAFVGAPVSDDQGHVYVAARNGNLATVLCFNADQQVFADLPASLDPTRTGYQQRDEVGNNQTLSPVQYSAGAGIVTITNFGVVRAARTMFGDLSEPLPILAQPSAARGAQVTQPAVLPLHTNLAWFTNPISVQGPTISGLTLVGTSLFFTDGSLLYKQSTTPQLIVNKEVPLDQNAMNPLPQHVPTNLPLGLTSQIVSANLGTVNAAPSVGGSVMVLNGSGGIATFTRQFTLIADNNRVVAVDTDGSAIWAVDSTTRPPQLMGQTGTDQAATQVDFNRPTSLTEVAPNDYLVADTGNNRCVRFDRGGNVIWELTRFNDPNNLLAPGETLALNQPGSVQIRQYHDAKNNLIISYLVADSGNNRIIEITDTFDAVTQQLVPNGDHALTWISRTGDKQGRTYRYGSARYLLDTTTQPAKAYVLALISNIRVAPLIPASGGVKTLGPAGGDAPGGCIVRLAFDAANINDPTNGYITDVLTSFLDVNGNLVSIRNPRFLDLYTQPGTLISTLLYADDNGVYDLNPVPGGYAAQMQFTSRDYANMNNAIITAIGVNRRTLPFVPVCVQVLGTDSQTIGTTTTNIRHYLITQGNSQSELGHAPSTLQNPIPDRIGGEVFQIDVTTKVNNSGQTTVVGTPNVSGGFGNLSTLSQPIGTGPLTQPSSAIRPPE